MNSAEALIVIDIQNGIFELPAPIFEPDRLVLNVRSLLDKARVAQVPVFLIQHCGPVGGPFEPESWGWKLHASLDPVPTDYVIQKSHPDACQGSQLEEKLKKLEIETVAVCGFATPYCVDTTVRGLYSLGFKVLLAADGHTTTDGEVLSARRTIDHHNWIFTRFATVGPAADITFSFRPVRAEIGIT